MTITTSSYVGANRERVFLALVDRDVLQRCIPGCETLTANGPDAYTAVLKIGVAGLKGTYSGKAVIRDRQPPESLTIEFDGKGGPGFVRGSAAIALAVDESNTRVVCEANVHVGGLIASVGSRLVEAAARKLAADFFTELSRELETHPGLI